MAAEIKPNDLGEIVYQFGGYDGVTSGSNAPKSSSGKGYQPSDKDEHFVLDGIPFSFRRELQGKVHAEDYPFYKLILGPASGTDTDKIIYLPYYDNNITSVVIPIQDTSIRYFITDALSGCNFYIDQLPDHNLVCYHANAQYAKTDAPNRMDVQHHNAMKPGVTNVFSLRQDNYYAGAIELEKKKVKKQTDREFFGGTTVMGFRVGEQWQFSFQTYGRLTYTSTGFLKSKGEHFGVGKVPLQIVSAENFWSSA